MRGTPARRGRPRPGSGPAAPRGRRPRGCGPGTWRCAGDGAWVGPGPGRGGPRRPGGRMRTRRRAGSMRSAVCSLSNGPMLATLVKWRRVAYPATQSRFKRRQRSRPAAQHHLGRPKPSPCWPSSRWPATRPCQACWPLHAGLLWRCNVRAVEARAVAAVPVAGRASRRSRRPQGRCLSSGRDAGARADVVARAARRRKRRRRSPPHPPPRCRSGERLVRSHSAASSTMPPPR